MNIEECGYVFVLLLKKFCLFVHVCPIVLNRKLTVSFDRFYVEVYWSLVIEFIDQVLSIEEISL